MSMCAKRILVVLAHRALRFNPYHVENLAYFCPCHLMRRLNRTEYVNTIRDLLAVDIDVSGLLPTDGAEFGFDNIAV